MSSWIAANTQTKQDANNSYKFGTQRDSRQTALRWRETITLDNAITIQEYCHLEMKEMKYVEVSKTINNQTDVISEYRFSKR